MPVMTLVNDGYTAQKISDWLMSEHQIHSTARNVSKTTQKYRKLEQESKKLAIQEAAAASALNCVKIIDDNILLLNQEAIKLLNDKSTASKLAGKQLAEVALKFIDKKMNLSGMDKEEITESDHNLLNSLLRKIGES